ncbi:unnamed protein product [Moneuplotes crassus]|uniref:Uncharacterized protein n=1 Tax=Euplotes crassus TaxID=5936 RepID=A0AAD1XXT2_EUPCR|nr:unnamed protein product [Moneuplotes crassus]
MFTIPSPQTLRGLLGIKVIWKWKKEPLHCLALAPEQEESCIFIRMYSCGFYVKDYCTATKDARDLLCSIRVLKRDLITQVIKTPMACIEKIPHECYLQPDLSMVVLSILDRRC